MTVLTAKSAATPGGGESLAAARRSRCPLHAPDIPVMLHSSTVTRNDTRVTIARQALQDGRAGSLKLPLAEPGPTAGSRCQADDTPADNRLLVATRCGTLTTSLEWRK